jgi:hypothetical protein
VNVRFLTELILTHLCCCIQLNHAAHMDRELLSYVQKIVPHQGNTLVIRVPQQNYHCDAHSILLLAFHTHCICGNLYFQMIFSAISISRQQCCSSSIFDKWSNLCIKQCSFNYLINPLICIYDKLYFCLILYNVYLRHWLKLVIFAHMNRVTWLSFWSFFM